MRSAPQPIQEREGETLNIYEAMIDEVVQRVTCNGAVFRWGDPHMLPAILKCQLPRVSPYDTCLVGECL